MFITVTSQCAKTKVALESRERERESTGRGSGVSCFVRNTFTFSIRTRKPSCPGEFEAVIG